MTSIRPALKVTLGVLGVMAILLAAGPAEAGLFRKKVVVVAPTTVVVAPAAPVYAAPVAEVRAVYAAPVVAEDLVETSYTATVTTAPARVVYEVPVVPAPRPVKVVYPRRVYRFPY